ncbi:MAG: enoyl-CoA hydratase [Nitrospirae bacterium]|nr:enoyl-CoA hydratase [Nitrospirota bacterium]MBI3352252.1 enoyl-CoA hydratase [Nitrospirota bacterium]
MANQFINYTVEDHIAGVTINHPPANTLGTPVMREIEQVFTELEKDQNVRAIVFTGAGQAFISGADIKEIASINSAKKGEEVTALGQSILNKIEKMEKPVIAAINGWCLGGGLELAMACHMRIASERGRFGQPEINLGIIPGFGGTQRLVRIVGKAKAMELILTGDMITAPEAKEIGLVNKVVPEAELMKQATGLAKKIAQKGQVAVRKAMNAMDAGTRVTLEEGLRLESKNFGDLCETEDKSEGIKAFLEKRQPRFQDK